MTRLTSPSSTAVIDVPDELVGRYEASGWKTEKPKAERKTTGQK
ncbi:hypothetical protein PTW37_06530 [Arthrobacter agilis]|nr:hypothetical protein [Arthrobacter agilis]WDF34550.1 hypothetical protein PTW37_06530 [Arthrobacter agilis]